LADLRERGRKAAISPPVGKPAEDLKSALAGSASEPLVEISPVTDFQLAKDIAVAVGMIALVIIALLALGL